MIRTGGVSITGGEILNVVNALLNGWNDNASYYIKEFEKQFADYVGSKYAYATTGGTQALFLSLAALNIKKGDEVIIPDLTYFACSDVVVQLGATPVFVDILKDTWCIDPKVIERAITPKTKAIMPVHIYGNACEMDSIMKIAKKHKLFVIEDACPAVGTFYKNRHVGSFSTTGCFSFHGAKIMTTGFGGMVVTNDKNLYERIVFLDDHGENKKLPYRFWQEEVGYSSYMHNINAALGLAQLDRIEEFVEKKRLIFDWYFQRLSIIEGLSFNYEQPKVRSNRWLFSIVLDDKFKVDRNGLIKQLRKLDIDTRPFFYPISMFPMYKEKDTPIAHKVALNGLNLPSGIQRTENEIDFISSQVAQILCG